MESTRVRADRFRIRSRKKIRDERSPSTSDKVSLSSCVLFLIQRRFAVKQDRIAINWNPSVSVRSIVSFSFLFSFFFSKFAAFFKENESFLFRDSRLQPLPFLAFFSPLEIKFHFCLGIVGHFTAEGLVKLYRDYGVRPRIFADIYKRHIRILQLFCTFVKCKNA